MFEVGDIITIKEYSNEYMCYAVGKGRFPRMCIAKIKHPDDMVFKHESGKWFYESQIVCEDDGIYYIRH